MKALLIARTEGTMAAVRQCTDGKSRIEHMKVMLPQRIEDGHFINCSGDKIGTWDGEDQEIFPLERLVNATRCTDALMNEIYKPINGLFGTASERAKTKDECEGYCEPDAEGYCEPDAEGDDVIDVEIEPDKSGFGEDVSILKDINKAIEKGKLKKAKSLLEASKEILDHDDYKSLKKQIKKAAKNG